MDRRKFIRNGLHLGSTIVVGAVAVPAIVTLISPTLRQDYGEAWTRVGAINSFPINSTKGALIEVEHSEWTESLKTQLLYVRRDTEGDIIVFSRNCTDLSCPIAWEPGSKTFVCPCHGGIFSQTGEPMAGPPNRPLFRYTHRILDGFLEIDINSVPPIS